MALGKKSAAKTIDIAERRKQALVLRRSGLSLRDIGERLGVDHKTIHEDIRVMLEASIRENVDNAETLRAMELERLDNMLLRIQPQVNNGHLGAIDRALRISEQRAKLLGLFAPVKQDVSVKITWQDQAIMLIQQGELTQDKALELFDNDSELVNDLFARASQRLQAR